MELQICDLVARQLNRNQTLMKFVWNVSRALFIGTVSVFAVAAQNARVEVSRHSVAIPKRCEGVLPASLTDSIDISALVKEALCKGAGDMLNEYTYVTTSRIRERDKKGKTKEESTVYEVFFPTLKSGMRTRGVLVVTSRNGVPVAAQELEKERLRAAQRIEKEEERIARTTPAPAPQENERAGMLPLGSYMQSGINRESFGMRRGGVTLGIASFLKTCDLKFAGREQVDGRETLIFNFAPRSDAQFSENEKYIAQLTGEIWIDAQDRIVTRLVGWPVNMPLSKDQAIKGSDSATPANEKPPAVSVEMVRLPKQGIWLPRLTRINGVDYPTLFDGITTDTTSTYSDHIRFATEIKDVKVSPPGP